MTFKYSIPLNVIAAQVPRKSTICFESHISTIRVIVRAFCKNISNLFFTRLTTFGIIDETIVFFVQIVAKLFLFWGSKNGIS